MISTTLG